MKYIVGVDGGNTKTDYFLFTDSGDFVDAIRGGTCSHEALPDSFSGSFRVMKEYFDELFKKNNIDVSDVSAAVFGLAGCDTPIQKEKLEEVVANLGFKKYVVANDAFLPIKAASTNGFGVCSINGTGTCSGGIDSHGNYLQVGGIGDIVGDKAGGSYLARRAISEVFNYFYRFGKKTMLECDVLKFLEITNPYYMMDAISNNLSKKRKDYPILCKKVFEYANKGDEVSIDLLKEMANNLARSVGGCIVNLDFGDSVDVVLAGSVYVKGSSPILIDTLKERLAFYTKKNCNIIVLNAPPATGAIIWALEVAHGKYPSLDVRKNLCHLVEAKQNQMESR